MVDVGTHTAYADTNTSMLLLRIQALGGDGGQADQALCRESASMLSPCQVSGDSEQVLVQYILCAKVCAYVCLCGRGRGIGLSRAEFSYATCFTTAEG